MSEQNYMIPKPEFIAAYWPDLPYKSSITIWANFPKPEFVGHLLEIRPLLYTTNLGARDSTKNHAAEDLERLQWSCRTHRIHRVHRMGIFTYWIYHQQSNYTRRKICHIKDGWYGIGTQAGSMSDLHLQFGMLPDHSSMPCRLHSHMYLHYQLAKKGYTPPSWNLNMELEPSPIGTVSRV